MKRDGFVENLSITRVIEEVKKRNDQYYWSKEKQSKYEKYLDQDDPTVKDVKLKIIIK